MKLTIDELQYNYNTLLSKLKNTFSGERLDKLLIMYSKLEDRVILAPASSRLWWHNAFAGGYVLHVLHVIKNAENMAKLYKFGNGTTNFSQEELVMAAAHHDLGKIGDLSEEYYIPNESEWHIKNKQEIFTYNPKLNYMTVTDRAIWLLQQFEIKLSLNEFLAIKLSDGIFEDANKKYYLNTTFRDENQLRNNLCYIIHWADWMSTRQEYDTWKATSKTINKKINKLQSVDKDAPKKLESNLSTIFDDLFNTGENNETN